MIMIRGSRPDPPFAPDRRCDPAGMAVVRGGRRPASAEEADAAAVDHELVPYAPLA